VAPEGNFRQGSYVLIYIRTHVLRTPVTERRFGNPGSGVVVVISRGRFARPGFPVGREHK
jgi:hypothetical protein